MIPALSPNTLRAILSTRFVISDAARRENVISRIRQRGGKRVIAFAGEGHFDPAALTSNTFDIEWPPRSGRRQSFPEVDRAEWFDVESARTKMLSGQVELLDRLLAIAAESDAK
jgi:predicted NUDIX family NTP pyrophosphohydrolase